MKNREKIDLSEKCCLCGKVFFLYRSTLYSGSVKTWAEKTGFFLGKEILFTVRRVRLPYSLYLLNEWNFKVNICIYFAFIHSFSWWALLMVSSPSLIMLCRSVSFYLSWSPPHFSWKNYGNCKQLYSSFLPTVQCAFFHWLLSDLSVVISLFCSGWSFFVAWSFSIVVHWPCRASNSPCINHIDPIKWWWWKDRQNRKLLDNNAKSKVLKLFTLEPNKTMLKKPKCVCNSLFFKCWIGFTFWRTEAV